MPKDVFRINGVNFVSIEADLGRPFVFDPYCVIPRERYERWEALLKMVGAEPADTDEYLAWLREKEEREAAVHFCGDFGGTNKKGEFCAKRVDGPGCRCEHHGGMEAEQGHYGPSGWPRPKNAR